MGLRNWISKSAAHAALDAAREAGEAALRAEKSLQTATILRDVLGDYVKRMEASVAATEKAAKEAHEAADRAVEEAKKLMEALRLDGDDTAVAPKAPEPDHEVVDPTIGDDDDYDGVSALWR